MSVISADFYDGKTSIRHAVHLILSGGRLKLVGSTAAAEYDLRRVRVSPRLENAPRWVYLPDGGVCVTKDHGAITRAVRESGFERLLQRLEARSAYAAVAVLCVFAAIGALIEYGVPAAVERVSERIPRSAEASLGSQSLDRLDGVWLRPSTLRKEDRDRIADRFSKMTKFADPSVPYQLEFRDSEAIGANAFALPSGIIVVTDQLIKLTETNEEALAVLAHELGHVRYRHTMRRLLESSLVVLIIGAVTGDVSSTTSLAASAPTVLLYSKYSRDFEREADRYAIDLMRRAAIDPKYFGKILRRLQARGKTTGVPAFLSSHPATEERAALIDASQ